MIIFNNQSIPFRMAIGSVVIFALIGLIFMTGTGTNNNSPTEQKIQKRNVFNTVTRLQSGTLLPHPKTIGEFKLVDQDYQSFENQQLQHRWHLLFMGFTHCPHICPTEMQVLKTLFEKFPQKVQSKLQIIFISTDPLRDTPGVVKSYVQGYHKGFVGLTGTQEQIKVFAGQFAMPFMPSQETDSSKNYEVSHSASFYLTNPQGQLVAVFSTPHDVNKIYQDLLNLL